MSGGVDSAVAAARAVDAGHDVIGVHLALSRAGGTLRTGSRGCCTIEDAMDARRAADRLGIPFYVWDFSRAVPRRRHRRLRRRVLRRPHAEPVHALQRADQVRRAAREGASTSASTPSAPGHYAIMRTDASGPASCTARRDDAKDQSYVLGVLTAEQLAHTLFPLGETPSKALVRAEAAARGLTRRAQARQPRHLLHPRRRHPRLARRPASAPRPATVVDRTGAVVGTHEGAHAFTVGQRRGPVARRAGADGKPRFVLEVRPVTNTVVVGPEGGARDRARSPGDRVHVGRARARGSRVRAATCRSARTPTRCPRARVSSTASCVVRPDEPFDGVAPGQTRGALRRHPRARPVHGRPDGLRRARLADPESAARP